VRVGRGAQLTLFSKDVNVKQKTMWVAGCALALVLGASSAQAQMQQWEDKGYVSVNLGLQTQSRSFTEISTPEIYGENALITVPHNVSGGILIDVAGGVRVWRNLAVGVGFSSFGDDETPTLAAEIPSPLGFGAARAASASTGELNHSETAVHVQLLWMVPMTNEFEFAFIAGPSFYSIKQDFVGTVTAVEGDPPFATVTLSGVVPEESSKTAVGVTFGVDGTYRLSPRFGAGAFIRYSAASADLETAGGGTVTVDAGGFQVGAGLRVRF
jgi:hypothetical protein